MTENDDCVSRWLGVAQIVVETIARANSEGRLLTNLYLYVDPDSGSAEIVNTRDFHVEPVEVCSLHDFDENGLLTIDDTRSRYILYLIAELIDESIAMAEEEGYDDDDQD